MTDAKDAAPLLYLDDLRVGQRFASGTHALSRDEIVAFAARFDPQPFHLDDAAARETPFGGLAASGWHTAAITMRLLVTSDFDVAGGLVGLGLEELNWPRPTRPGDELRVEVEVLEARRSRSRPGFGLVRTRTTTLNQDDEIAQQLVNTLIVPCREAP